MVLLLLAVAILPELSRASRKRLNREPSVPPGAVRFARGVAGRGSLYGVSRASREGSPVVGDIGDIEDIGGIVEGGLIVAIFPLAEVLFLG